MFTVKLTFNDGEQTVIDYSTIGECLDDRSLRGLFDNHLIQSCTITKGDQRIAGIPIMTWDRFTGAVDSNSQVLSR